MDNFFGEDLEKGGTIKRFSLIYIQIRLGYFSPWKLAEEYDSWIEIRPKGLMAHNKPKI